MTTITMDELLAEVNAVLEHHGLPIEDFIAAGLADSLDDDDLCDLWLAVGPILRHR